MLNERPIGLLPRIKYVRVRVFITKPELDVNRPRNGKGLFDILKCIQCSVGFSTKDIAQRGRPFVEIMNNFP